MRGIIQGDYHVRQWCQEGIKITMELHKDTAYVDVKAMYDSLNNIASKLVGLEGLTELVSPYKYNEDYIVVGNHKIPIESNYKEVKIDYKRLNSK